MTDQSTCFEEVIIKEEFIPNEFEDEDTKSCKESDFKLDLSTPEAYESFIFNLDDQYKQIENFNREENGLPTNVMGLYVKDLYILHSHIPLTDSQSNLFDTISYIVFSDSYKSYFIRSKIVKHIVDNWRMYKDYAISPADQTLFKSASEYMEEMLKGTTRGGGCELLAAAEVFDLRIELYVGENRSFFCGTSEVVRRIKVSPYSGLCHFDPYEILPYDRVLETLGKTRTVMTQTHNNIVFQNNEYIKAVEQHLLKLIFPEVEVKEEKNMLEAVGFEPVTNYLGFETVFLEETHITGNSKRGRPAKNKDIAIKSVFGGMGVNEVLDMNKKIIGYRNRGMSRKFNRSEKSDPRPAKLKVPVIITRSLRYRTVEIPPEPEEDESAFKSVPVNEEKQVETRFRPRILRRSEKPLGRPRKKSYFNFHKKVILPGDLCNVQIKSEVEENPTLVVDINIPNEASVGEDEQFTNHADNSDRIKIEQAVESIPSSSLDGNGGNSEQAEEVEESSAESESVPLKVKRKVGGKPLGRPRKKRRGRKRRRTLMYSNVAGKTISDLENVAAQG